MHNFDDSSDEEDIVEALDNDIVANWNHFSKEVLEDLKQRTNLLNEKEKSDKKSLYFVLDSVKKNSTILKNNAEETLNQIATVLQLTNDALAKEKHSKLEVEEIKSKAEKHYEELSKKIKLIFTQYNNLIKTDIKFVFPELEEKASASFSFKTAKKKIKNKKEYNDLLKTAVKQLDEWLNEEKAKIEYVSRKIKDIQNTLPQIDKFIKISTPNVDESCKLSFAAHYIGTSMLHHKKVAKIYEKRKEQHLINGEKTKSFQNILLTSSFLLSNSLTQFNEIYKEQFNSYFFSNELLNELSMELKNNYLRFLLKKMNGLNDYFLFRKMYDCINKTEISFGRFIKLSNQEIIGLIKEKYPIFEIESAKVIKKEEEDNDIDVTTVDEEDDDDNIEIFTNEDEYSYKNFKGPINTKQLKKVEDIKRFILSSNVAPVVNEIYNICKYRTFDSAKKFYIQGNNSDTFLIEDTLRLIPRLSESKNAESKKERVIAILTNETEMFPNSILQQIFILILRREFYKIESLERVVLPETFKFTTISPAEFLSNIRLCNRSLTRHSRNLLQNPNTRIQIDTIDSGAAPLVSIAKTWHFPANENESLTETKKAFFAVDRQTLNSKRSEKKKTLLSREHYVAEVGAYSEIHETFLKEKYLKKEQSSAIVTAILKPIYTQNPNIKYPKSLELNTHFYFTNLFYLLFGLESIRNPAMFVINRMLLELLESKCIQIDQLFSGNGKVKIEGSDYWYINGLMPTAPKSVTARSREINNLYHRYMQNPYIYPGDLSRSTQGIPSVRDEDTKLKLGLNHLMYREALVVTMWYKHKTTNKDAKTEKIEDIAKKIAESAEEWWGLKA